ncbi:DUF6259 domain-containing protein [uncultured Paludibaculum sp.]|uniref:DUF6259 domain-containing protein n=1 Tax=uncultured Paludibaculum sp. TaxID=1765020 RepID=UPI002AAAABD7|nr:DUF6259 domain-containing protein [uncultured Paludibaculum sp.]
MKNTFSSLLLMALPLAGAEVALQNANLQIAFNEKGALTSLVDRRSAPARNLIAHPKAGFWKIVFQRGRSLENVIDPGQQTYRLEKNGNTIRIVADSLRYGGETLDIGLAIDVTLSEDEIRWQARIQNGSQVTISEFFFPEIGGIDTLGGPGTDDLLWPQNAGARIRNVRSTLTPRVDGLSEIETPVNGVADQRLELLYPGHATMDWYELTNDRRGIYFASYDPSFLSGSLLVSRMFTEGGSMTYSFVKYAFVRPGETWQSGQYVTAPHPGTWHASAGKYRQWANTWFRHDAPPDWVAHFKGMLLVILRQQYGDVMWHYDDIPFLYEEAQKNGMDMVSLFGWTEGGHDNQYPIYKADPEMGGEAALRRGLAEVTTRGGHTLLYLQGHLMDPVTDWYTQRGAALAARNVWGTPYYEQYNKGYQSSLLRNYTRKLFAMPCTLGDEWSNLLVKEGREKLGFGPSALIYDQLGGMPAYPCFGLKDDVKPSAAFTQGRLNLLKALRSSLKQTNPHFGLMFEHNTDIYAQYADIIHCAGEGCALTSRSFPQLFRYTFPEIIITSRDAAPRVDPKQVNHSLAYGMRFELEVRYRADVETIRGHQKTQLRDYIRSVSQLRDRYWDLLGNGRFLDDQGLTNQNRAVTATAFASGQRRAVVLWNNSGQVQPVRVSMEGKKVVECAGVAGKLATVPAQLRPQEIAVVVFE